MNSLKILRIKLELSRLNIFVSFLSILSLFAYFYLFPFNAILLQITIVSIISCSITLYLNNFFNKESNEIYKTFKTSSKYSILLDYYIIIFIYIFLTFLLLTMLFDLNTSTVFIFLLAPEALFLSSIAFLTLTISNSFEVALIFIVGYIVAALFGILDITHIYNVFILSPAINQEVVQAPALKTIYFCILLQIVNLITFNEKYN